MAKAKDFLLNTDYEMDKIIYYKEVYQPITIASDLDYAHNLDTAPLIFGIWSTNADFSNSHELGTQDVAGNRVSADSTENKVHVSFTPAAGVSTTFYVRLYGFEPHNNFDSDVYGHPIVGNKIPPTSDYAETFILNTDYNYLKLKKAVDASSGTIYHGLGYTPHVMVWGTYTWDPQPIGQDHIEFWQANGFSHNTFNNPGEQIVDSGVFVDNENIYWRTGIVVYSAEVRIYADEA